MRVFAVSSDGYVEIGTIPPRISEQAQAIRGVGTLNNRKAEAKTAGNGFKKSATGFPWSG